MCSPAQIAQWTLQMQLALMAGDTATAAQYATMLNDCAQQGADDGLDKGLLPEGREVNNPVLNPTQPHGDQNWQRAIWDLTGSPCGRCSVVPRYWKLTFDWSRYDENWTFEDIFGISFTDHNKPGGGIAPYWDFRNWYETIETPGQPALITIRRGPMAHTPVGNDPGSFDEALQARAELEYSKAFWKKRIQNHNDNLNLHAGNPRNVAWFLYYDALQADDDIPWKLAVIENTKEHATSGGGSEWINTYQPLVEYALIQPEIAPDEGGFGGGPRKTCFACMGKNEFEVVNNTLSLPDHTVTVVPHWP